ncbi:hypothetical protein D3C72_1448250 [compost metagenome]
MASKMENTPTLEAVKLARISNRYVTRTIGRRSSSRRLAAPGTPACPSSLRGAVLSGNTCQPSMARMANIRAEIKKPAFSPSCAIR